MFGQAEARAAFMLRLRAHGIQDLAVLRALERVPRELFVPHHYADLARRDVALPIGCGQTLSEPSLVARMVEALAPAPDHHVLEIGTGSGYATAIVAEIARKVISIERFQSLAIAARLRLEMLGKQNVDINWGDGLALPAKIGLFDRILVNGRLDKAPSRLTDLLAETGQMIFARQESLSQNPSPAEPAQGGTHVANPGMHGPPRQRLVRISRGQSGNLVETILWPCRLQALMPGFAHGS